MIEYLCSESVMLPLGVHACGTQVDSVNNSKFHVSELPCSLSISIVPKFVWD